MANFVPVNSADNWLHLGLAVIMITAGILAGRTAAPPTTRATDDQAPRKERHDMPRIQDRVGDPKRLSVLIRSPSGFGAWRGTPDFVHHAPKPPHIPSKIGEADESHNVGVA